MKKLIETLVLPVKDKDLFKAALTEVSSKPHEPILTYSDLYDSILYSEVKPYRNTLHIGHRKLFLVELDFLTKVETQYGKEQKIVVYAGAAPYNHGHLLTELFPNIKFILVDPAKFDIRCAKPELLHVGSKGELTKEECMQLLLKVKESKSRLFCIQDLFTNILAEAIAEVFPVCFFESDIRTVMRKEATSLDILWNLAQQFNWVKILNPKMSTFKFRHPYYTDEPELFHEKSLEEPYATDFALAKENGIDFIANFEERRLVYLDGVVRIQPWAPVSSTETRLIVGKEFILKDYDTAEEYENKFFWYNNVARSYGIYPNDLKIDTCNDCAIETHIWKQYISLYPSHKFNNLVIALDSYTKSLKQECHACSLRELTTKAIAYNKTLTKK